MVFMAFFSY